MVIAKNGYLNFYLKYEKDFIEELGYHPLRPAPDIIVRRKRNNLENKLPKYKQKSFWLLENNVTTLKLSIASEKTALTKAIIVRECLLSFFSKEMRINPVIYAFVYRKLLFGENTLNTQQKKVLNVFYKSTVFSLEQDSSLDNLVHVNYNALKIYMPENRIEESFRKYAYGLANFSKFFTENDFEMPDAILTDIWLKLFYAIPFKIDEFHLFFEMIKLFNKLGEPFSLQVLAEHICAISIEELKDRDFSRLMTDWQKDLLKLEQTYLSLSNRSAAFTYKFNWNSLDIVIFYYFVRFNKNLTKEVIDFAFNHMTGLVSSRERLFEGSIIKYGYIKCRTQDFDILNEFFEKLELNRVIDEYISLKISQVSYINNIQNSIRVKFQTDYEKYRKILKPDIIDFILMGILCSNFVGFKVDFELTDFFIENLRNELRTIELQKRNRSDIFKRMAETKIKIHDIKFLIPLSFRRKENVTKVKLNYLMGKILKKYGKLAVKFIYDNIFKIYKIFYNIFTERDLKLVDFNSIKEFLKYSSLRKKDPESFIFFKQIVSSLEQFFAITKAEINFRGWIFDILLFFEKNLKKNKEIIDILQTMCDYLRIINLSEDEKNISVNIEKLTNYLKQTQNEIHIDLENRIRKMKEYNLIVPNMLNSIAFPNLYTPKTLLLKNVGIEDKRIQVISKQFPFIAVMFSQNSNSKYVVIENFANSDLNKSIYDTIHHLFKGNLIFFSTYYGDIYSNGKYNDHSFYNFQTSNFDSLKPIFDNIRYFLLYFKKHNADYPDKIFKIFDNHEAVTKWNKNEEYTQNFVRNKIKLVLKDNYIKNNEKNLRLAKIIADTEKDFSLKFDASIKSEIKGSALKYNGFPNFGYFNMSLYVVQTTILKKIFTIKGSERGNTSKFLLPPGFLKIKTSTDLGPFQRTFIEYVTPREDPPVKIFNYALRRNIISKFRVMRILKIHVNFNPTYFFNDIWNPYFEVWSKIAKKITTNPKYRFDPGFKTFDFISNKDKIYSKDSIEFETVVKSFENSLRMKYTGNIKELINLGLISPFPHFDLNKLQLNEKVIVFFGDIGKSQKTKILMIFSMFPQVKISEIDYFESNDTSAHHFGLYLELNLPHSRLDQLYFTIYDLTILMDIKNYEFIPSVIDLTPHEFTDGKIKKRIHPIKSHIWSKRTKTWKKIRYFNKEGVPLNYQDRINQLES